MNDYFDQAPPVGTNLQERAPKQARIAIQNATDDPNLGRQVVNYLAERGFNNVFFSEERAPRLLETTEVIVQKGDLVAAAALQEALDLGKVQADSTGDLYSEITLRVGSDWLERAAAAANEDD